MVDPDTFRAALGRFASGVTVLTARDKHGADFGMTVSAFSSQSLVPPMVLFCIGHDASMHALLMRTADVGISILSSEQEALSRRFAESGIDPFEGTGYSRGEHDVALLNDAVAHLECRIVDRHDAGDHTIMIANVERTTLHDRRPLLYYRGGYTQFDR